MIIVEYYMTRKDGVVLYRTYSDRGVMIERDGELYIEAIDPVDCGRIYTETEFPIPADEPDNAQDKDNQENADPV